MTAQEYIQSKLEDLRQPSGAVKPATAEELPAAILKALLSKKFRKYAASPELIEHIKNAININIEKHEPINITFVHGAYKLWRLSESPEADWAELFALMYYSDWVKSICELYEPGVWFDFFVDDRIIPMLDNVEPPDIETYIASYQSIMNFLKPYQPANLKMTITPVSSRFESPEAFDQSVQRNLEKVTAELPGGLPELDDAQKSMVELNTKVTNEQAEDPEWREKVYRLHNAYMITKSEPGYHKRPDKIIAFNQPLPSGTSISVGSTKDSIMKFWIGVGVLKPKEDSFRQIVLSPNQLARTPCHTQGVHISGLDGKNFNEIRIMEVQGYGY